MRPARESGNDSESTFRSLFEAHYRDILSYARRRTHQLGDAEDIAADTFAVAWRRIREKPTEGLELAWLYGIAARVLANHRRGRRRFQALKNRLGEVALRTAAVEEARGNSDAELQSVVRALKRLKPEDQEVLRLSAWEELNNTELGAALGCSENAATIRLHRARQRLARELKEIAAAGHSVSDGTTHDQEAAG